MTYTKAILSFNLGEDIDDLHTYGHLQHILKPEIGNVVKILKFNEDLSHALVQLQTNRLVKVNVEHLIIKEPVPDEYYNVRW